MLDDALSAAFEFFKLPAQEKMKYMSNDVHKPVRYSTSLKDEAGKIQFWRAFLKHYSHPLETWIGSWPDNPPNYRYNISIKLVVCIFSYMYIYTYIFICLCIF